MIGAFDPDTECGCADDEVLLVNADTSRTSPTEDRCVGLPVDSAVTHIWLATRLVPPQRLSRHLPARDRWPSSVDGGHRHRPHRRCTGTGQGDRGI